MLTPTATVLLALTLTATPTMTVSEKAAYDKGWQRGVDDQFCLTQCNDLKWQIKNLHDEKEEIKKISSNDEMIRMGILEESNKIEDAFKNNISEDKSIIKKNHCDCSRQGH